MPDWTPQQQQAISARNRTILVSAAAGSGKTAVLVERIVQLIREGWPVDRMLIVTFTKAAASEMRQRLSKRLVKEAAADPEVMGRALDDLESTEIATIHSFCQKVLKNNFQVVGIDPMVKACDEQLRKVLFAEAWLEAFNQLLEDGSNDDFMELAYCWDQRMLEDMTGQLHNFLMSLPFPFNWLEHAVNNVTDIPFRLHPWYKTMETHAHLQLEGIGAVLHTMEQLLKEPDAVSNRRDVLESDRAEYERLMFVYHNQPQKLLSALDEFKFVRAKPAKKPTDAEKEWMERFKKQREKAGEIIKKCKEWLNIDEERLQKELPVMQRHLRGLALLTEKTDEVFRELKGKKHVIDFSDMEQYTMNILAQEEFRAQMQAEYDHIFVDECQDVSQVQDAILQSIHHEGNFMFMVGDVKQSIYRFRKADPTLFLHRLHTFSDDEHAVCRRIILQKNFRSRYNVLEATNQIFRVTMRPKVTELTYEAEDELICGRNTQDDPPVEMHLLDVSPGEDGEKVEALEAEVEVLVERIRDLLNQHFMDGDKLRNYTYRDMVILLSAAANTAPKLVELLSDQGIPVYYDGAASFYALPEVQSMKALLTVIDNPLQDLPLLATLKMAPFSLDDRQLAMIRCKKTGRGVSFHEAFMAACDDEGDMGDKCREIRDTLARWRFEADNMRLSDFVWRVMHDSGYYAVCGALPKGELRQANLRMMYQRTLDFEQSGGETLADLLQLMDQQSSGEDNVTARTLGENENLVRIMTMHKSKGLEFPVVFCMQMSGKLHKSSKSELLMHSALGVALPYVNRELNVKRGTIVEEAFRIKRLLDDKAERARLLYVAMTRARERLIMIGCCKGNERTVWEMPPSDYRTWLAGSMTDWIMQGMECGDIHNLSTSYPKDGNPWCVRCWDTLEGLEKHETVDKSTLRETLRRLLTAPMSNDENDWVDVQRSTESVPLKTSVSALAKKHVQQSPLPITDMEEDPAEKRAEGIRAMLDRSYDLPEKPAFMEEKAITGAERGTLLHRAISLMPLDELRQGGDVDRVIHVEMHRMLEREIFSAQELLQLDLRGIGGYFRSDLGQRMLASVEVHREWEFNLLLDQERGTLLQGVIDCCFREGDGWVLVDYKTDRIIDEEAFIRRYDMQLEWYARALERITGTPVKEMWLYAISRNRAYPVERRTE